MRVSASTSLQPDVLVAQDVAYSPSKHASQAHHATMLRHPSLNPLIYAHQLGWARMDPGHVLLQGGHSGGHYPPDPAAIQRIAYTGLPPNSALPAMITVYPPQFAQSAIPAFQLPTAPSQVPPRDRPDPFVYANLPPAMIKHRERIPQACERCRKRKSRCTGTKPRCKGCADRDANCVYVLEHRANRTKAALAAAAAMQQEAVRLVNHSPPRCPPAGPSDSSSSGYSPAFSYSSFPGHSVGYTTSSLHPYCTQVIGACPGCPPLLHAPHPTMAGRPVGFVGSPNVPTVGGHPGYAQGPPRPRAPATITPEIVHTPRLGDQNDRDTQSSLPHTKLFQTSTPRSRSVARGHFMGMPTPAIQTQPFASDLERRLTSFATTARQQPVPGGVPPPLSRDASTSSSDLGIPSGMQTPADYLYPMPAYPSEKCLSLPESSHFGSSAQINGSDSTMSALSPLYPSSSVISISCPSSEGLTEDGCLSLDDIMHSHSFSSPDLTLSSSIYG